MKICKKLNFPPSKTGICAAIYWRKNQLILGTAKNQEGHFRHYLALVLPLSALHGKDVSVFDVIQKRPLISELLVAQVALHLAFVLL